MSSITEVKNDVRSFHRGTKFLPFSGVTIVVTEEVEYSAGTDTGRVLTLENPWGSQEMADNILESILGYQYQPYWAKGAIIDPAAELGDGVIVCGIYSGVYAMDVDFGSRLFADISAPAEEEIDHEYKYIPQEERRVTRSLRQLTSDFKVQAGLISAEITERKNADEEIYTILKATSGNIAALVEKKGGDPQSFGWTLNSTDWTLHANGLQVLKADKDGVEITGKITATSGKVGGFDIGANALTYNNQAWGGTNETGAYLGIYGIQLGKNFKVDMQGNLSASSGTFAGTIYAGNIVYGEDEYTGVDYGTISGSAISSYSIGSSKIKANSLGTDQLSAGVNTSLDYADKAGKVFAGEVRAYFLKAETLSGHVIKMGGKTDNGYTLGTTQITYKDGSDTVRTLNVVTYTEG